MNRREFLAGISLLAQRKYFLVGDEPVVTVRQPYLQNVRQDRASVMWATESAGEDAYVAYSTDGKSYKSAFADLRTILPSPQVGLSNRFTQYVANLSRLSPDTRYFYYPVVNGEAIGPVSSFRTATRGNAFQFLVLGDSGMGTPAQTRVASRMARETAASFVVHVGDIAYGHGFYGEFQKNHFDVYQGIMNRVPFFPAPGNHEYDTPNCGPYLTLHSLPTETVPAAERGRYYSFDWGNVHFVSLDSNADFNSRQGSLYKALTGTGDMLNWLKRDLKSTRQFWKVVYMHHPPYSGGRNLGDPVEQDVRNHIAPILESNGVQLVMSGHEHNYQRTRNIKGGKIVGDNTGTIYMTLGGGGADLYPEAQTIRMPQTFVTFILNHYARVEMAGPQLILRAFSDVGTEFDNVVLKPLPVLEDSNSVTFDPSPAAGSLVRIRGFNLAVQEGFTQNYVTTLAGTSVTINDVPITLIYVSPTQIVGQLAEAVPSSARLAITTPNGIVEFGI